MDKDKVIEIAKKYSKSRTTVEADQNLKDLFDSISLIQFYIELQKLSGNKISTDVIVKAKTLNDIIAHIIG